MKSAGLIYDHSIHYIDHLAPFCSLKKWPLIVCEGAIADLARRFYPDLQVIESNPRCLFLPPTIVSCGTKSLIESSLGIQIASKILWLPHGNSDKGWKVPFFESLQGSETALVYGQKMIDFMAKKNAFPPTIHIGNFRLYYAHKHRLFYKKIIKEEIHLPKQNKTYLYAPTWQDAEDNSSFWKVFPSLASHLPNTCNLLVKIHPNTYSQHLIEIEVLIGRFQHKKNIFFLIDFPPIYPLLDLCDAYIGDMSSIGYDFLKFDRPMFFLNTKKGNAQNDPSLFLYRCGIEIPPDQIPALFTLDGGSFTKIRKQIYDYTFTLPRLRKGEQKEDRGRLAEPL